MDSFPNSPPPATVDQSPTSAVHKWFNNILKPPNATDPISTLTPPTPDIIPPRISTHRRSRFEIHSPPPPLPPTLPSATNNTMTSADPAALVPPRLSTHRRSRFQNDPNVAQPHTITSTRTIKTLPIAFPAGTQVLFPPQHLVESAQRRSISSSTCSFPEKQILSPPRNLVESAQRRSISSSTCFTDKFLKSSSHVNGELKASESGELDLIGFLKEQRIKILKLMKGEIKGKAKIVLSGHSNSKFDFKYKSHADFVRQVQSLLAALVTKFPLDAGSQVTLILSPTSFHIPVIYFSVLSLGVTVSPVNPISTKSELTDLIRLSNPVIAVATSSVASKLPSLAFPLGTIIIDSPQFLSMLQTPSPNFSLRQVKEYDTAAQKGSEG